MLFCLQLIFFIMVSVSYQSCRSEGCWNCSNYADCCGTCKCDKSIKYQKTIDTFGCDKNKCHKFDEGKCKECVDGYYLKDNICFLCNYPCIECSSYKCKKCASGYKLSNDKCIQCSAPLCKYCGNDSLICNQCVDNAHFTTPYTTCECNSPYVSNGKQCKICNPLCGQCVASLEKCITCNGKPNMMISPIDGVCNCNNGYFWNSISESCEPCTTPCSTCEQNSTQCTSCNNILLMVNDQNICTCKNGYLSSSNNPYQCEICSTNCFTCSDFSNKCTSCNENYQLNDDTNICFCPDGYFETNNVCNQCHKLCSKCLSTSVCTDCIENTLVTLQDQKCNCIDGFYFDINLSICQKCDLTCKTCSNYQICNSCYSEMNRILNNQKCTCQTDYFLNDNQLCISCNSKQAITIEFCQYKDCSDGVWSYGEECDDANYSSRDGCNNCTIEPQYYCINELLKLSICRKCQQHCAICEYDYFYKQPKCQSAVEGYYIENSNRINKCSDKCLHCQFNSSQCTKCRFLNISVQNINCQLCEYKQGYYSDYEKNSCYSKCGDGIIADIEQCDDGNQTNGDGCNDHCFLEKNFDCHNGICSKSKNPIPSGEEVLIYDLYTPKRQILITYDQELKIDQQFDIKNQLEIQLNQYANTEYLIKSNLSFEKEHLTNLSITILIEVDRSITNASLLIKYLTPQLLKNAQNQSQEINLLEVKITDVVVISQSVQGLTTATINSSNYIIYSLLALLCCGIVTGGVDIYFNLIDTLQYLSYLYYINTIFPYNVNQFFLNLNFAQFTLAQDFIKLDQIFQYDFQYNLEIHSLTVPFKIKNQGLYSCFILNFASIFSVFLISFALYILALLIQLKFVSSQEFTYLEETDSISQFQMYYLKFQAKLKHFALKWALIVIREFFYSDLLRIFMTTTNEYSFTLGLGLKGLDFQNPFGLINSIITIIFLAFYILITYQSFIIVDQKRYAIEQVQYYVKFGSVFSGLQISKYQKLYNPLLLIKKFLFMTFLIYLYDYPLIQVLQITLLSLITLFSLIIYQPIKEKLELIKQICCETSQCLTLIFFTVFCINDLLKFLNQDQKLIIGWIVISIVLTALFTQLVINTIQQWKYLYSQYGFIRKIVNPCIHRCKSNKTSSAPHDVFL